MLALDLIQCPVCFMVETDDGIFNCANGHVVCGKCRPKVKWCPVCREPSMERSPFCERLAKLAKLKDETRVSCTYADFGCRSLMAQRDMLEHEKKCVFWQPPTVLRAHRKTCQCVLCVGVIDRPVALREPTLLCEHSEWWTDILTSEKCCCTSETPCKFQTERCDCYMCHSSDCLCASVCKPYWNTWTYCLHLDECDEHGQAAASE